MPLRVFPFLLLSGLLLTSTVGCGPANPSAPNQPTALVSSETPEMVPSPTPASLPPSPTAVTATGLPSKDCVEPKEEVHLAPVPFLSYGKAVRDFLNQGGSRQALDEALYAAGVASQPVATAQADLTGDGLLDVVVSIFDPQSQANPPGGSLYVYACQSGQYSQSLRLFSEQGQGAPLIRELRDLNADGQAELLSSQATCGAHTCFEDLSIWMWNGSEFEDRLLGETVDLPYPTAQLVDPDGDGLYDLRVTSSGFGSVGAGPQRNRTRIWAYNEAEGFWQVAGEETAEPVFRIHALHDADTAAAQGDYPEALLLYQRVISDAALQEWNDPPAERELLAAAARYKIVTLYTVLEQEAFAETTVAEMGELYPDGSRLSFFTQMAQAFREGFAQGGASAGCKQVRQAAAGQEAGRLEAVLLESLGTASYGYGNPDYTLADLCPWE